MNIAAHVFVGTLIGLLVVIAMACARLIYLGFWTL